MPATETRSRQRGFPVPYDFRRPTKLARDHSRVLETVFETLSRQWAILLTTKLRTPTSVHLESLQQRSYLEVLEDMPGPSLIAALSLQPLGGTGMFILPVDIALGCVERMLGGPGTGPQPQRALTEIETVLVRGMLGKMAAELRHAFAAVLDVDPKLGAVENSVHFPQVAAATDVMVAATLDVQIGTVVGTATLVLPYESLGQRLTASEQQPSAAQRLAQAQSARAVSAHLDGVSVDVSVRFRPARLSSGQILSLQVGDVVRLPHAAERPLAVLAAGVSLAEGVPGSRGARLACLVTSARATEESA